MDFRNFFSFENSNLACWSLALLAFNKLLKHLTVQEQVLNNVAVTGTCQKVSDTND
jgi:hypothetical protein